jgi:hypothetical protein
MLLIVSAPARAQNTASGDAACGKVMDDAVPGCTKVVEAENELHALKKKQKELEAQLEKAKTPDEAKKIKDTLDETNAKLDDQSKQLDALKTTPLERLDGFCSSLTPTTARTCDALASRLGAFDEKSLKPITEAAKADGAAPDAEVAHDAGDADRRTSNNKSGSSGQVEPVESIQPITLAGGAFTLAGTHTGMKGVGTITVNPLALAKPTDAVAGRMLDLTVSAPFDLESGTSGGNQYVSARLRVNMTAPISARELKHKVDAWLGAAGQYADKLEEVLKNAKDVQACTDYIAVHHEAAKSACDQDVNAEDVRKARLDAYAEMARARRAADKYYVGLDARFDAGDPTGPKTVGDKGTHLLGGLAAGTRIAQGPLWDWELRGRVAGDYFQSHDPAAGSNPDPVYSVDWGAAFIFSGRLEDAAKQRMAFGVGMEGRQSPKQSANAKLSPTNFANLNLMVVIPAVSGGDLGLAFSIPVVESREPRGTIISLSTDLGLLDHSSQ